MNAQDIIIRLALALTVGSAIATTVSTLALLALIAYDLWNTWRQRNT